MKNLAKSLFSYENVILEKEVFGLKFKNPVGLAAGFDKNGVLLNELACMGFGFIEVGTVTPLPQSGNDLPRLFRLPKDEALINRMGFNNMGVKALAQKLKSVKSDIIIGGNIGKNKATPNEDAILDYEICFRELFTCVNYFVVNVSSPNTPNLRDLQDKEPLKKILIRLNEINTTMAAEQSMVRKPILLKIAPDLSNTQLDDIIEIFFESKIDGIVATNTTISRDALLTDYQTIDTIGLGGLSGKPLKKRSTEVIKYIVEKSGRRIPVIGVGGIFTAEDAEEKLAAGAALVQIYSGYIYQGPSMIKKICKALAKS